MRARLGGEMTREDALARARDRFEQREWSAACDAFGSADDASTLGDADLELLAQAAYLCGRDRVSEDAWTRAYHAAAEHADWARAARCGFWLGIALMSVSQPAAGAGWIGRVKALLDETGHECVVGGWLLIPIGLQRFAQADYEAAAQMFEHAGAIGRSYADTDLVATARQAHGRALIRLGSTQEGVSYLDESMIAVLAGEVSPIPAGIIYCSVVEACNEILDFQRAREWTEALTAWCDDQPDLVMYRGRCSIHRSEIMQRHGDWDGALAEATAACERLADPPQPQLGAAVYQRAEMHRLRGEFAEADAAYREASERGRQPQPGLALLRLAQGKADVAGAAMRTAMIGTTDPVPRAHLLSAAVEVFLAVEDRDAARRASEEYTGFAEATGCALLIGHAHRANGAVLLAEGELKRALEALHAAWAAWVSADVPYDVARAGELIAVACRALGDEETARLELDKARATFEGLGAGPDAARATALATGSAPSPGGLSAREIEVLALVAAGGSNKEIAEELFIAERTVARHMSNIFTKLGVNSRTAASAFAHRHGLV